MASYTGEWHSDKAPACLVIHVIQGQIYLGEYARENLQLATLEEAIERLSAASHSKGTTP